MTHQTTYINEHDHNQSRMIAINQRKNRSCKSYVATLEFFIVRFLNMLVLYIFKVEPEKPKRFSTITKKRRTIQLNVLQPNFHINELVWAHVRGYPFWPGVIEKITPKGKYLVHFFGDYSRSELGKSRITNFYEGFNRYSTNFGNIKLKKAVEEARIFLISNIQPNACMVCMIPMIKKKSAV